MIRCLNAIQSIEPNRIGLFFNYDKRATGSRGTLITLDLCQTSDNNTHTDRRRGKARSGGACFMPWSFFVKRLKKDRGVIEKHEEIIVYVLDPFKRSTLLGDKLRLTSHDIREPQTSETQESLENYSFIR